jgi:hypothetical protein
MKLGDTTIAEFMVPVPHLVSPLSAMVKEVSEDETMVLFSTYRLSYCKGSSLKN